MQRKRKAHCNVGWRRKGGEAGREEEEEEEKEEEEEEKKRQNSPIAFGAVSAFAIFHGTENFGRNVIRSSNGHV